MQLVKALKIQIASVHNIDRNRLRIECGQKPNLEAVSVYVLVAIIKKRLKIEQSLYTILQILSVPIFEKMPIYQALTNTFPNTNVSRSLLQSTPPMEL